MHRFVLSFFVACLLSVISLGTGTVHAAATCEDLLLGNEYLCTYKTQDNGDTEFFGCFEFAAGGTNDFQGTFLGNTLACSCQARGSLKKPKYDAAKDFICAHPDAPWAVTGKAAKNKIKKGQVLIFDDFYVYECELVPSCS